ncbi:MAG: hypothetical protein JNG85_13630 [Spirochaetaceae bacterium]|nr:hypothetical protein [Spirochaetaceae bacterium]
MTSKDWILVGLIVLYAAATLGLTELFRRKMKAAAVILILSLFTFPLWAEHRDSWFEWAKILSVLLPTALLNFARIANFEDRKGKVWELLKGPWLLWFFYGMLFVNITEAALRDWQLGFYGNAIAGFALNATIPFAPKFWRFDRRERGDLIVDFPMGWCLLYTTWNACFLFGSIPDEFAGGLAILLAAEFYSLVRRSDLYIMGRVYTLALFVLQLGCFDVLPGMDSSHWANPVLANYWGLANAALGFGYILWYNWQMHTGRCDRVFRNPKTAPLGEPAPATRQAAAKR